MQIVLRVLVTMLALLGIGGALVLAFLLHGSLTLRETIIPPSLDVSSMEEVIKRAETAPGLQVYSAQQAADLRKGLEGYSRGRKTVWFLDAAGLLGVFAIVLGLMGRGKSAAVLLLAAFVGPVVLTPTDADARFWTMVLTGGLPLAGLLAFFIRSTQRPHLAGSEA